LLGALVLALPLAACDSMAPKNPEPTTTVKVVTVTSYPELPDIPLPPEPALIPWEYELPRDMSRVEPKSPECGKTPEANRDDSWDRECGVHPVIRDSNVMYGFDQRNWNILLSNLTKLREYIAQLKGRIDTANATRREYREKAQQEREKAEKGSVGAAIAPAVQK
jgi:hypothetical protein